MSDPKDFISAIANWTTIVGGVQQLPQTILAVAELVKGRKNHDTVQMLHAQLECLTNGFAILDELKTFHDEAQILHNSLYRIHEQTGAVDKIDPDYLQIISRQLNNQDLPRFLTRLEGMVHIKDALPHADLQEVHKLAQDFNRLVRAPRPSEEIIDVADSMMQKVVGILTRADSALRRAIGELVTSVIKAEGGAKGGG